MVAFRLPVAMLPRQKVTNVNPQDGDDPPSVRDITMHQQGAVNRCVNIKVLDGPGPGNASHEYQLSFYRAGDPGKTERVRLSFQNGPLREVGVNGLTNEALLAILIDRMHGFQAGKFRCGDNRVALEYLENALSALQRRTREREARGVEGTLQE